MLIFTLFKKFRINKFFVNYKIAIPIYKFENILRQIMFIIGDFNDLETDIVDKTGKLWKHFPHKNFRHI